MSEDALIHCVRVPKSGSKSLLLMLGEAFAGRRVFYLPDTLRPEAALSRWQAFRLWRSQRQNLMQKLGTASLSAAFARIEAEARPGDLIAGGHSDHGLVRRRLSRPVRFVTLLRDPAARALSDYHYARAGYLKKKPWQRFDAHRLARVAAERDFAGFLDFQLDHAEVFSDPAAAFLGWRQDQPLEPWLADNLWDWATLETAENLAKRIAERLDRPTLFGRHNSTEAGRLEITADERRRIDRLCARDQTLYERCRADNRA
ncbi:sulfotransferase domain-containing protein [Caulobacter sp. NIBR1757]|uniref:sulfotransferase domain-containing protein n=1 Tax=Caulobacter sp. NIBR1757 TaxID=3016000 RepID=UPI0022F060CB|nr:sulfotransferase domain-containing protein [Caulobacter sp. NIBR1757]WGM37418.1 hypothetical protein AMEJIAPC_00316 [Caulobacter sp. NIBR1757]